MIRIDFLALPGGGFTGFSIRGHSGYGEEGTDIVCAAVSSAAYLVVNAITDILHVTPMTLLVEDGNMFLRVTPRDEPTCRDFLAGLKLHLQGLEEQYPEYVRVSYTEI